MHRAVPFDRDNGGGIAVEQRSRQTTGTGADFDHRDARKVAGRPGYPACQVEVEQEVLSQRLAGTQVEPGDDLS